MKKINYVQDYWKEKANRKERIETMIANIVIGSVIVAAIALNFISLWMVFDLIFSI